MSKLSYKSLFIILFFLLIGIVVLAKFLLPKNIVKAAWWNDDWNYRQAINISSHTTAESNVYITTIINIGSTNKAQIDDGDFRFISQSGDSLSYYIVSGTGTTNVTFHVQIPTFPAGPQIIYAYYGNSSTPNGFASSDFSTPATNYTIGSYSAEEVGGGPIAYWKFDEGVGTTAYDSANNHNGILQSGTSWESEDQCISGKCLKFDGIDDYVAFGVGTSYLPLQTFSMCAWEKTPGLASGMTLNGILSFTYGLTMDINASGQFWTRMDDGVNLMGLTETTINLHDNKWHYLCLTYDGTNRHMYIDGNLKKSTATTWNNRYNTNTLNIGHDNNNSSIYKFNGWIDEPKIYNYARTPDQIKIDYNSRGSVSSSSTNLGIKSSTAPDLNSKLITYYKFNEGIGTTIFDSSYQQKNATLTGTTLPTWIIGKFNKGLDFNASGQRVVIGTTTPLTGSVTATLWYKRTNTASSTWRSLLADKTANIHQLISQNTTRNLGIWDGNFRDFGYNPPDDNQFHHYAVIYNIGTSATLYVDGNYKNKIFTTLNLNTNPIGSIGNWNSGTYWAGAIDEVKIYNSALSPDEIKQDYNQGSAIQMGSSTQTIGATTTSLDYCIPGDTSYCASPIAEWNFEENTGTTFKDSVASNNIDGNFGTGNSGPNWTSGKNGSALGFDGINDYVEFTDNFSSNKLSNFSAATYSFWIYPQALQGQGGFSQYLLEKRDSTISTILLTTGIIDNRVWYSSGTDNWTSVRRLGYYNSGIDQWTASDLNKWYFITIVYDSTTNKGRTYINGILDTEVTLTNAANQPIGTVNTDTATQLGRYRWSTNNFFQGKIDRIKIYNYARTRAQIAYDYSKGGPIGWWKFDECQGNIANNSSAIGNTGSINIGPSGIQNTLGTCQVGTSAAWTAGASGKINGSLYFDGQDDYMTAPITISGSEATIAFWIKNPARGASSYIFRSNANNRTYINVNSSGNQLSFTKGNPSVSLGSYNIVTNSWNHVVFKWWTDSSSTIYGRAYINGQPVGTDTSFLDSSTGSYIVAGAFSNTGTQNASGQFDDVRVYNYALTDEQIKQLYNGGAINFN